MVNSSESEVIDAVTTICDNHHLEVNIAQSVNGAAITTGCSFIGGLIGGPIGMAVGGTVGAFAALQNARSMYIYIY